ncbi:hypothetical protein [Dactylosporangium sp. CA-092794]|uniref:hypothetical protein n=1 Tax=Dactylosporangium sp. CA-092794 TaxID=3239929 RepID=UPI003D9251FB
MYTTEELRRALTEEAEGRTTRLTHADIRAAAARRRWRIGLGGLAALLVPVLAAGAAVALGPGGPSPAPMPTDRPATVVPWVPDPSLPPPAGPVRHTGLNVGDQEFVVWYQDEINGVSGGLIDAGGRTRRLEGGVAPAPGRFGTVLEVDDRHGGLIDYGVFGAAGAGVEVTAGGSTTAASTAPIPGVPDATMFWVRRGGVAARPTGAVDGPSPDAVFTARGPGGAVLGTGTDIQRSDGGVNRDGTARPIGEWIHTGHTLSGGGELVFWFDGDDRAATAHAGSDDGAGTVTELKPIAGLHRPPFAIGFYGGYNTFDLAGGGTVTVGIYAGPAATVEMSGRTHGSAAWTAHPELRIFWATGAGTPPTAVAEDGSGHVVDTTDFQQP